MTATRQALGRLRSAPMILMYHAVADEENDPNQLCVPPAQFAAQLDWMAAHGLRGVSVGTLLAARAAGTDAGMVGITFDDGYVNLLSAAVPELASRGFGATAFLISGRIGGRNVWDDGRWPLLDSAGVRELAGVPGIEVGSHTVTHPRLAGLGARRQAEEVTASRAQLEDLVAAPVRGFAYPYGSMDGAARHAAAAAGYQYACAVRAPLAAIGPLALPRTYVGRRDSAARMTIKRRLHLGYVAIKGRNG